MHSSCRVHVSLTVTMSTAIGAKSALKKKGGEKNDEKKEMEEIQHDLLHVDSSPTTKEKLQ